MKFILLVVAACVTATQGFEKLDDGSALSKSSMYNEKELRFSLISFMFNYSLEKFTQCTFNYGVAVEDAANRGKGDYVYFWLGHDDRSNDIRLAKQLGKTVAVYTYMIPERIGACRIVMWAIQVCVRRVPTTLEKISRNLSITMRRKLVS